MARVKAGRGADAVIGNSALQNYKARVNELLKDLVDVETLKRPAFGALRRDPELARQLQAAAAGRKNAAETTDAEKARKVMDQMLAYTWLKSNYPKRFGDPRVEAGVRREDQLYEQRRITLHQAYSRLKEHGLASEKLLVELEDLYNKAEAESSLFSPRIGNEAVEERLEQIVKSS